MNARDEHAELEQEPDRPEAVERVDPRELPAAEEERHAERREDDHVDVLGRLEEPPAHAGVLGVVPGDELGVGLGEVERRPRRLGDPAEQEDDEPDELRDEEPERLSLPVDDLDQVQRAAHDHDAEHAERERDLVGDELRAGAHRAEHRELRVGGPAADDEAVDADRAEREDHDQPDREVRDRALDVVAVDRPAGPPRDHREREQRGEAGDDRREDVGQLVRRRPG